MPEMQVPGQPLSVRQEPVPVHATPTRGRFVAMPEVSGLAEEERRWICPRGMPMIEMMNTRIAVTPASPIRKSFCIHGDEWFVLFNICGAEKGKNRLC